jgi:hypothetical protein
VVTAVALLFSGVAVKLTVVPTSMDKVGLGVKVMMAGTGPLVAVLTA